MLRLNPSLTRQALKSSSTTTTSLLRSTTSSILPSTTPSTPPSLLSTTTRNFTMSSKVQIPNDFVSILWFIQWRIHSLSTPSTPSTTPSLLTHLFILLSLLSSLPPLLSPSPSSEQGSILSTLPSRPRSPKDHRRWNLETILWFGIDRLWKPDLFGNHGGKRFHLDQQVLWRSTWC